MDDDYPDCKLDKVKLEPELMLDDVINADALFTVSHQEGSHHVSNEFSADQCSAFPEKIELKLAYGLPSVPEHTSSASGFETVMIKEEPTEEETPSPVSYLEGSENVPSETSAEQSSNFPERIESNLAYGLPPRGSSANGFEAVYIKEEPTEDTASFPECSPDSTQHYSSKPVGAFTSEGSAVDPAQSVASVYSPCAPHINSDAVKFSDESCITNHVESVFDPFCSDGISLDATSSTEKRFSCNQCSARFKRTQDFRSHQLTHANEKPFSCDQCSAQFNRKTGLQTHLLSHSNEKPFCCDQCPAQFTRKSSLNRHLSSHSNERTFACNQCPARFNHKNRLKRHSLSHSNEKAFSCDQCSARFVHKEHLRTHLTIHTNKKAYSCKLCSARFNQKSNLTQHLLSHSDERAFSCDLCSAQFKRKDVLQTHMLIHSNKKAFSCHLCSARYHQKGNLKEHLINTHTNEKAFSCGECSTQFKWKHSLQKHLRVHCNKKSSS